MNGSQFFSFIQKFYWSQFILLTNVNNNVIEIYFAQSGVWDYSFDRRLQSHQSHFVRVTSKFNAWLTSASLHQQRRSFSAKLRIVSPAVSDAQFILLSTVMIKLLRTFDIPG
jgi:hypothetical protein